MKMTRTITIKAVRITARVFSTTTKRKKKGEFNELNFLFLFFTTLIKILNVMTFKRKYQAEAAAAAEMKM